ncbi:MAG: T9SS type A sorting domain-containing protein [Chitinophagaceae bacterium]|nr:T9SS type A sorting domain-containing protein [Chitinophagaceae bacterium]
MKPLKFIPANKLTLLIISILFLNTFLAQVIKPYSLIYTDNIKGSSTIFGNTSLHIVDAGVPNLTKMNETGDAGNGQGGLGFSQYGNDNENMQLIDIDGISSTANSSSSNFTLPVGTNTIKFARLYWGGRIAKSVVTAAPDTLRKVKIRRGTGAYSTVFTAAANVDQYSINTTDWVYQAYIDITTFMANTGTQTYTVADIPLTTGSISGGGRYGGWAIVVVYENPALSYNSVRIYDGYLQVYNGGSTTSQSITLNGLNVPNNPLVSADAIMSEMTWEGDANLSSSPGNPAGDYLKINGNTYSNAMNPATNMWNGSITKNGVNVSTKNPNYTNQMGIDIDEIEVGVGYGILPNATDVAILFGTEADQYFPSLINFVIKMKDPTIELNKSAMAASGSIIIVLPNEKLTYTISGGNTGLGTAYNTVVTDTIPANVTYVPGSMEVISCPGVTPGIKTDALDADVAYKGVNGTKHYVQFNLGNGATGTVGGVIAPAETYVLKFKVTAGTLPGTIVNTARINATSQAGDPFVDDGTATINAGSPTPVKLISFTGTIQNNNAALLRWETDNELNSNRFEIERSDDGIYYSKRGIVNAAGTSTQRQMYQFTDPLNTLSKIVYYRLRIIDINGKFENSKVIALRLSGSNFDNYVVYPNPFVNDIKLVIAADKDEDVTIHIISMDGRVAITRKITIQNGENIVVLKDLGQLQKGSYILEMLTPTGKIARKVVKE